MNQSKLQVGDYSISYSDVGHGPILIMLHGFLGNASVWTSLIARLSRQYRCISLDLLGFGDSSKPDVSFSIADQVTLLRQFIQILELQNYSLIGHSMGGWIAASYALQYQNAGMERLILLAAAGIPGKEFDQRILLYLPLMIPHPLTDVAIALSIPVLNLWGLGGEARHFAKARKYFRERPIASEKALQAYFQKTYTTDQADETIDHLLHNIKLPTLVIAGEKDSVIPISQARSYIEKIPCTESLILTEAKHNLHMTHAGEIAAKISAWSRQGSEWKQAK